MRVIVVGGGIGGLTLAFALARRRITTVVIEQAASLQAVGAGLQLSPNATRILSDLGLDRALAAAAVAPGRAEVHDAATGRRLIRNRLSAYAQARWGSPYLVLTRSALQAVLLDAVERAGGVEIRLGSAVTAIGQSESGVSVTLADGAAVAGAALFGCDGLNSTVRAWLGDATPPRFTGQTAWRGLAQMATEGEPGIQVWTGPGRHFVRYPVGPGLVNMVAVTGAGIGEVESWEVVGQGADLAAAFADWPEPVRATIAAVGRPWRSALYDRPPLPRWSAGRVTLLGDAAHPMLPFLAQGAAMAIEDAWVAADRLSRGDDVAGAFTAYEQARLARTARAQAWATRNAALFHLPSSVAAGVFGAARALDRLRGRPPEARFDWLYGWRA